MDVRTEEETAEGGRGEEGVRRRRTRRRRVRAGDLRADRQACLRACVRAWPTRGEADRTRACPPGDLPYERGPRTPAHLIDGVIINLDAS